MVPEGLKYTTEHEWIKVTDGIARIGITHYAQEALGDIVFIQLPEIGADVRAGVSIGEVESTKSVSDLFAPVDGTIVARNEDLDATPEAVNTDPYESGWMLEIKYSDQSQIDDLLDADTYKAQIG